MITTSYNPTVSCLCFVPQRNFIQPQFSSSILVFATKPKLTVPQPIPAKKHMDKRWETIEQIQPSLSPLNYETIPCKRESCNSTVKGTQYKFRSGSSTTCSTWKKARAQRSCNDQFSKVARFRRPISIQTGCPSGRPRRPFAATIYASKDLLPLFSPPPPSPLTGVA